MGYKHAYNNSDEIVINQLLLLALIQFISLFYFFDANYWLAVWLSGNSLASIRACLDH